MQPTAPILLHLALADGGLLHSTSLTTFPHPCKVFREHCLWKWIRASHLIIVTGILQSVHMRAFETVVLPHFIREIDHSYDYMMFVGQHSRVDVNVKQFSMEELNNRIVSSLFWGALLACLCVDLSFVVSICHRVSQALRSSLLALVSMARHSWAKYQAFSHLHIMLMLPLINFFVPHAVFVES